MQNAFHILLYVNMRKCRTHLSVHHIDVDVKLYLETVQLFKIPGRKPFNVTQFAYESSERYPSLGTCYMIYLKRVPRFISLHICTSYVKSLLLYVYVYTCVYMCIRMRMHMYMRLHMHMRMRMHMYMHMHMYMYISHNTLPKVSVSRRNWSSQITQTWIKGIYDSHIQLGEVITHSCPYFNCNLAELPLLYKSRNAWINSFYKKWQKLYFICQRGHIYQPLMGQHC